MSRLSRDKKRDQQGAARPADGEATPIEVRVTAAGPGADGASVGGVPVVAAPGEELQHAVLAQLHRIAFAAGHPVLATVRDERIGYVVPLRVDPDGSSQFTAEPVALPPAATPEGPPARTSHQAPAPAAPPVPEPVSALGSAEPEPGERPVPGTVTAPTGQFGPPPVMDAPRAVRTDHWPEPPTSPEPADDPAPDQYAYRTPNPYPQHSAHPERAFHAEPDPAEGPLPYPAPDFAPAPVSYPRPATTAPAPATHATHPEWPPAPQPIPGPDPTPADRPAPVPAAPQGPARTSSPGTASLPARGSAREPEPKPTPARGFDAVAEAVLGDEPLSGADGTAPPLLAEPVARINEAVRSGRIDTASALAQQTVTEASGTLGPAHPEVLRLRELDAYIAYLADDPVRSLHLSLDLARQRRSTGDAEGAYGNVQSAATAWRAVRNPVQGLNLGVDLIALWSELAAQDGPAADDIEQLDSARTRMTRLADRARKAGDAVGR
ncbi:tetratricopeptide repeat protein [Streptomyces sp. NPDC005574]|uniref:tetratricopeptide repeat protein n=1 Tax=Streptomyces sp. NPDC005574 TaxID=3156891 RepID=UPI0033B5EFA4